MMCEMEPRTMSGGKAVVEVLRREEVEKIFSVPGESFLPVTDALYEHSQIELITTRHEGGAAFMAEGYGKVSGKVGVCMATRGVGSTNLSIGIHTAFQDSTPMVALIGQVESQFIGREGFQEIDLGAFYGHITKWAVEIREPKRIPEILHRAFRIASSGRPGPVLVGLPTDILYKEAEMTFQKQMQPSPPAPNPKLLRQANQLLSSSKRPLIIVGGGIISTNSQKSLVKLSELTGIPVMVSFRRHDAFPNSHKHYGGQIGFNLHPKLKQFIQEADVILAIGMKFSQVTTQNYTLFQPGTKLVHIDIDESVIGKVYNPEIGIVSDAKQAIQELIQLNQQFTISEQRANYCREVRECYEEVSIPRKKYCTNYVDLEGMIHDLQKVLPDDAIITNDSGNFTGWLQRYYQFNEAKTYIGPTSGAMGYALPSALGAKLAFPDRKVVSVSGDGGFMMTLQELETSKRQRIPITAIVINNNMYGTIRMHQERHYPGRVIGTELTNPDYVTLARAFGVHAERVERNDQFVPALERALQNDITTLIEVRTDPNKYSLTSK